MTKTQILMRRRNQRGAIALEYILIAALVAIALIATFVYFRSTLTESGKAISDTTKNAVTESIKVGSTIQKQSTITPGAASGQ